MKYRQTLEEQLARYLAAVDVFRSEGREPAWLPEREPDSAEQSSRERPAIGPHRRPQSRSACGGAQRAGAGLTSRSSLANLAG